MKLVKIKVTGDRYRIWVKQKPSTVFDRYKKIIDTRDEEEFTLKLRSL